MLPLELETALEALTTAGRLAAKVQADLTDAQTVQKADRSPVTVADYGAQAIVCQALLKAFPDTPIVAEEDAGALDGEGAAGDLRAEVIRRVQAERPNMSADQVMAAIGAGRSDPGGARRYFVLDPIDGTKGFIRGDQYAAAAALIENGRVVMGLMACPNLPLDPADPQGRRGVVFHARLGQGAFMRPFNGHEDQPIGVSSVDQTPDLRFVESFEPAHSSQQQSSRIMEYLGVQAEPVRMDSMGKYGLVASGRAEVYIRIPRHEDHRENIWDHAAGALLAAEAGGRVTDILGRPLDFASGAKMQNSYGILTTNGPVHHLVLEALRQVSPKAPEAPYT